MWAEVYLLVAAVEEPPVTYTLGMVAARVV